jgi:hypothetical protein
MNRDVQRRSGLTLSLIGLALLAVAPAAASPFIDAPAQRASPRKTDFSLAAAASLVSRWGTVSSLTRSSEHNRAVGGAERSFHLVGRAIDVVRRAGVRHRDIEAALLRSGLRLAESIDEGDHSHFAFEDGENPSHVTALQPSASSVRPLQARNERLLADDLAGELIERR